MNSTKSPASLPAVFPLCTTTWRDAYSAFLGAFDTPLARRKQDDEFAIDARRRMREINEAVSDRGLGLQDHYVEIMCARIKAADDAAADRDYMLDSNDCISVLRGTWLAPSSNECPPKPEAASEVSASDTVKAWMHKDDPARVISDVQKQQALHEGGANATAIAPYSIALVRE